MAMKDWKKVGEDEYVGKKFILTIDSANNLGEGWYTVSFKNLDGTFRTNTPNTKVFTNKKRALRYAKAYMGRN